MGSSGEVDMSGVGKLTRLLEYMGRASGNSCRAFQGTLGGREGSDMDQVQKDSSESIFFIIHFV